MATVVFANSKGGAGKTTFCDEFAWWLDRRADGPVYQIVDMDGQGSLIHRAGRVPGADVTLVDLAGEQRNTDERVLAGADVVVVPFRLGPRDRPSTERTLEAIARSAGRALTVLVLNGWGGRTRADKQFARSGLSDWLNDMLTTGRLPRLTPIRIVPHSALVPAAAIDGRSVVDYAPRSSVAAAIDGLGTTVWDAVCAAGDLDAFLSVTDLSDPWALTNRDKQGVEA